MKLKDLIKRLQDDKAEFHDQEVEFFVCTKDKGQIVTMELEGQAQTLSKILKMFKA